MAAILDFLFFGKEAKIPSKPRAKELGEYVDPFTSYKLLPVDVGHLAFFIF